MHSVLIILVRSKTNQREMHMLVRQTYSFSGNVYLNSCFLADFSSSSLFFDSNNSSYQSNQSSNSKLCMELGYIIFSRFLSSKNLLGVIYLFFKEQIVEKLPYYIEAISHWNCNFPQNPLVDL